MKTWQVLYLRPRTEKKLAGVCGTLGLPCYLPLRRETKIYQRRRVVVDKPVFPGYLFAAFTPEERPGILKTNNVLRMIEPPNQEELLHELTQIRQALSVDPTLGACTAFRTGTRVRITGGPFLGIEGIVQSLKGSSEVRLNVDLIGQAVAVVVDRAYLEVIH